jgi:hypothetical protein
LDGVAEGKVKLSRFLTIVEAYGAAPEHWPERERPAAVALCRSSAEAANALARARAIDAALRQTDGNAAEPSPARLDHLHARIMAAARDHRSGWFGRVFGIDLGPAQLWPSLAGLAVATGLGIAVGMSGWMQIDTPTMEPDDFAGSSIDIPMATQ